MTPRRRAHHVTAATTAAASAILALLCGWAPAADGAAVTVSPNAPVTISPLPGTPTAMPTTQISFLGAAAGALHSISVVGSESGHHSGHLRSYGSAAGASFIVSRPFRPGEQVTVAARLARSNGRQSRISTSFTIAQPETISLAQFPAVPGPPSAVQSFQSQPSLHPPTVTVTHAATGASAPGYIFATPYLGPGEWGPMIFDSSGRLVWFHPIPAPDDAADFRTQVYKGKNELTWWQGRTIAFGYGLGEDVIANANYKTIATVRAGNGLLADEHEFLITPQGSAWVVAYSPVRDDLSSVGSFTNGIALDCTLQEIDIHTGLVMWEWHSLGHVPVSASYSPPPGTPAKPYDYFHLNSLAIDKHGNLLISARNTWALYELNAHSGAITWQLGGKNSTFTLGPGVAFAYQHNALPLPNGDVSIFDDEGAPPVKPPARGELISIDIKTRTATLAGQLLHAPESLTTTSQGNVQGLPGGGWMVGWGGLPNLTEFSSQGQIVFDAQLPKGDDSYRVYREPWTGLPAERPAIVARTTGSTTAVYASWNGATTVASWQLLTGSSAEHLAPTSTTPYSGFQTTIPAPTGPGANCPSEAPCTPPAPLSYQVRALSAAGKVLASSGVVHPTA